MANKNPSASISMFWLEGLKFLTSAKILTKIGQLFSNQFF